MKEKELETFGFKDEWLDERLNNHGSRRDNLGMADFEFTKSVYGCGGLETVDRYLNSTANAWSCAEDLIRVVDALFPTSKFGTDDELYGRLVTKAVKEVFESMILALENAECHVDYDDDPLGRAEGYIRGFGYGLIDDIDSIIADEVGRVAIAQIDEFGRPLPTPQDSESD